MDNGQQLCLCLKQPMFTLPQSGVTGQCCPITWRTELASGTRRVESEDHGESGLLGSAVKVMYTHEKQTANRHDLDERSTCDRRLALAAGPSGRKDVSVVFGRLSTGL